MSTQTQSQVIEFESFLPPLREYQKAIKHQSDSLTSNHIIQLPTGTGKGNLILDMVANDIRQIKPVLVVVPSLELVYNLQERLRENIPFLDQLCSYVGTGLKGKVTKPFVIGVYKSVSSNLEKMPYFSRIYHDECHHSCAASWQKIIEHYPNSQHIGFTATPTRLDGRPLGDNFTDLITSPSVRWFIDNDYLCDYTLETTSSVKLDRSFDDNLSLQQRLFDDKALMGDIVSNWMDKANYQKTIVFTTGIDHALHLCAEFNDRLSLHGHPKRFGVIHSKQSFKERNEVLNAFKCGDLLGLSNVTIVTEGVDIPDAVVCVLARFTQSTSLFLQMVGRVLRYRAGKKGLIFDHAGNALEHGLPCFDHEWSLQGLETRVINDKCLCQACETPLIPKSKVAKLGEKGIMMVCPVCDYSNHFVIIPEEREPREALPGIIDGSLVEMTADQNEFKVYKILMNKQPHQKKVSAIVKLNVPREAKVKGLTLLGMSQNAIEIFL